MSPGEQIAERQGLVGHDVGASIASFTTHVQDAGPGAAQATSCRSLRSNHAVPVPVGMPVVVRGSDRGALALQVPADPGLGGAGIAFHASAMLGAQPSTWRLTGAGVETVR